MKELNQLTEFQKIVFKDDVEQIIYDFDEVLVEIKTTDWKKQKHKESAEASIEVIERMKKFAETLIKDIESFDANKKGTWKAIK